MLLNEGLRGDSNMSFSEETESTVNILLHSEYINSCIQYGDFYHSVHEAYAVLAEEIQILKDRQKEIWQIVKSNEVNGPEFLTYLDNTIVVVERSIKELSQVGGVLHKFLSTIKNKLGGKNA